MEDLDADGDLDIIGGNLGLNLKYKASEAEPFRLYVKDFDQNGTNDVYLAYYEDGISYPVRGRQCSSEQMPFVKKQFATYEAFATASVEQVLEGRLEDVVLNQVYTFESSLFINDGNGEFKRIALPNEAQIAPIYGILVEDLNQDNVLDILAVGNYHNREVETTRSDAGTGILLLGKGDNTFTPCGPSCSGISADRDARSAILLKNQNKKALLAIANNNDKMQFFNVN